MKRHKPILSTTKHSDGTRSKTTPELFPWEGPADIETAYSELSCPALAVWLKLLSYDSKTLKSGRCSLSKSLGYSQRRSNQILRELERKNYISFTTHGSGKPTEVVVERKLLIKSEYSVVRLSNYLLENNVSVTLSDLFCSIVGRLHYYKEYVQFANSTYYDSVVESYVCVLRDRLQYYKTNNNNSSVIRNIIPNNQSKLNLLSGDLSTIRNSIKVGGKLIKRRKFANENGYLQQTDRVVENEQSENGEEGTKVAPLGSPNLSNLNLSKFKKLNLNKFKVLVSSEKKRADSGRRTLRQQVAELDLRRGKEIRFENLDQRGHPSVSFDPNSKERPRMLRILSKSKRDNSRKKLISKLGVEFSRIYVRYRRAAEVSQGRPISFPSTLPEKERSYAEEAGVLCIEKGVTPRQVLEYWHEHIGSFARKGLTIPPVSILKSPAMIDQVACSTLDKRKKRDKPKANQKNTFANPNSLDDRLRAGIESLGFESSEYSDRFLATIQSMADSVRNGNKIFMSPKLRPIVNWAVENLGDSDEK